MLCTFHTAVLMEQWTKYFHYYFVCPMHEALNIWDEIYKHLPQVLYRVFCYSCLLLIDAMQTTIPTVLVLFMEPFDCSFTVVMHNSVMHYYCTVQ